MKKQTKKIEKEMTLSEVGNLVELLATATAKGFEQVTNNFEEVNSKFEQINIRLDRFATETNDNFIKIRHDIMDMNDKFVTKNEFRNFVYKTK